LIVKRLFLKAAGVAAAGALLKACGGGGGGSSNSGGGGGGGGVPTGNSTLLQILEQDGRFSILLSALRAAGLADRLGQADANQTLFAPTNDAFNTLQSRVGVLSTDKLAEFIGFHVVPQFLSTATMKSFANVQTPETLYSYRGNTAVLIFFTDNGPLNIWDGIGRTSITIPEPDLPASNGAFHVVSDVLVPRGVLTVLQILRASIDSFSEFNASVTASNTINALNGPGPLTVFVPSNEAISAALADNVVRQHVAQGEITSNDFTTAGVTLTTLHNNPRVTLRKGSGAVLATLNDGTAVPANVTDVDFFGSNGVVHVINRVLVAR
jgi:transforming growth factor-beta-induced protein